MIYVNSYIYSQMAFVVYWPSVSTRTFRHSTDDNLGNGQNADRRTFC